MLYARRNCHWGAWMVMLLVWAVPAWSAVGPLELVNATVTEVIDDMNRNEAIYSEDPARLEEMVHQRIVPHFNVRRMVQIAMAKNWATATDEQRQQVQVEFQEMLIRSYKNAMFTYRKEKISLNGEEQIKGRNATVKLRINRKNGDPVDLVLRMVQSKDQWQVIDMVVGGVSMLITFRSQFQDEISKSGVEGLIASLRQDNLGSGSDSGLSTVEKSASGKNADGNQ